MRHENTCWTTKISMLLENTGTSAKSYQLPVIMDVGVISSGTDNFALFGSPWHYDIDGFFVPEIVKLSPRELTLFIWWRISRSCYSIIFLTYTIASNLILTWHENKTKTRIKNQFYALSFTVQSVATWVITSGLNQALVPILTHTALHNGFAWAHAPGSNYNF